MHTTDKRIRGRKLQERRARWFARFPLCVHCERSGSVSVATELDHKVPLFKHGKDDETNLQGLCSSCHEAKTAQDMGNRQSIAFGADGYPVGG